MTDQPLKILLITPDAAFAQAAQQAFRACGIKESASPFEIKWSGPLAEDLQALQNIEADLILFDLIAEPESEPASLEALCSQTAAPVLALIRPGQEEAGQAAIPAGALGILPADEIAGEKSGSLVRHCLALAEITRNQRRSEARFNRLVASAGDGLLFIDGAGKIRRANPAAEVIFGYPEADLIDKPAEQLIAEVDRSRWARLFQPQEVGDGSAASGVSTRLTGRNRHGESLPLEISASTLERSPLLYTVHVRNLTWQERVEREILQRNEDLALVNRVNQAVNTGLPLDSIIQLISEEIRRLFNSLGAAVHLISADGKKLVMRNLPIPREALARLESFLGGKLPQIEHDLSGSHPFETLFATRQPVHTNDREEIERFFTAFIASAVGPERLRTMRPRLFIHEMVSLLGMRSRFALPLVAEGEIIGTMDVGGKAPFTETDVRRLESIASQLTGVIRRKTVEDNLAASEAELRALMSGITDVVLVYDLEKGYTQVWLTNLERLYRPAEKLLGRRFRDVFSYELAAFFEARVVEACTERRVVACEYELPIGGNTVWFDAIISPLSETSVVWVARDVTVRKQSQAQAQLQAKALEAAADGIFIADHEGRIQWINAGFTLLTGFAAEEAVGAGLDFLTESYQDESVTRDLRANILAGEIWQGEALNRRKDGSLFNEEQSITPVRDGSGAVTHFIGIKKDVSDRIRVERREREQRLLAEALRESAIALNRSLETQEVMDLLIDQVMRIIPCDAVHLTLIQGEEGIVTLERGYDRNSSSMDFEGVRIRWQEYPVYRSIYETRKPVVVRDVAASPLWIRNDLNPWIRSYMGVPLLREDQIIAFLDLDHGETGFFTEAHIQAMQALSEHMAIALKNAQLYQEAIKATERRNVLHRLSQDISISVHEPEQVFTAIHDAVRALMPAEAFAITMLSPDPDIVRSVYLIDRGERQPQGIHPIQGTLTYDVLSSGQSLSIPDLNEIEGRAGMHFGGPESVRSLLAVPLSHGDRRIGMLSTQSYAPRAFSEEDLRILEMLGAHAASALENARLLSVEQRQNVELNALLQVSAALRMAITLDEMHPVVLEQLQSLLSSSGAVVSLVDPASEEITVAATAGVLASFDGVRLRPGEGISGHVVAKRSAYASDRILDDPIVVRKDLLAGLKAVACAPMIARDEAIGVIWVARDQPYTEREIRLLTAVADVAANGIQRAQLFTQTERRLHHLTVWREIENSINNSMDLRTTLELLLAQIVSQLGAHAADILLFDPITHRLNFAAGRGFLTNAILVTSVGLDQGLAGKTARERKPQMVHEGLLGNPMFSRRNLLMKEQFDAYFSFPMLAKGNIIGVLEIMHREPLQPDQEWLNYLETLAGQAAIAIENAQLLENVKRTNLDLSLAYERTLEGWVRTLEMRDDETEVHSRRVTELTTRLALRMGVHHTQIEHVRRGALLHDIGKIAIPDRILNKPGPLDEDEWTYMKKHPITAFELLSPIDYLRPALEIPYCHHEWWDGTGYPRGLRGEEIPLAARIFAVVDVWDALSSDRPYRSAWSQQEIRAHLLAEAGTHFDPRVVSEFLEMLDELVSRENLPE